VYGNRGFGDLGTHTLTRAWESERARERNRVRGTKIKIERERREREIGRVRGTKMEN
jgi:hypothetical protein